ncbi:MAG: alpha/beta hydrolase [Xanthomonadales bacterium]|nr:alpha/beta hydrolase [Xanthomonadales bacterium]
MRLKYLDTRHGQVHARSWTADQGTTEPTLVCLHPIPYSGAFFETVAPYLGSGRNLVALDYPGYGGSPLPESRLDITQLAETVQDCLDALESDYPFDLLGFHTGCLVAAETARLAPLRVSRLVLVDVPLFEEADRRERLESTPDRVALSPDLESLEGAWAFNVTRLSKVTSLERAHQLFVEQLRAGSRSNWGFLAAFEFPAESCLAGVGTPARVVATASPLLEGTRRAADLMPAAELVELPEIRGAAFEAHAEEIADQVNAFLAGAPV